MVAIFSTLFRGLVNVAIVTLVVAVTWSIYIYREPITSTIEPATRLFQSEPLEPARAAATLPAPVITPVDATQTGDSTGNAPDPVPAGNTTTN